MKSFATLLLFVAITGLAPPAFAQDEVRARSLELNEAGFDAFEKGEFATAAEFFSQAYDLVPDPALRKNETVAWFKAKRCDAAIAAGNKLLLLENAAAADRAEVKTIIANCKVDFARDALEADSVDVAREFLAEAEALASDQHVLDQVKVVRLEIARREKVDASSDSPAPDAVSDDASNDEPDVETRAAPEPVPAWREAPAWQWALTGGGAALLLGGLTLHMVALGWQSQFLEMADEGGDPARFDRLRRGVHTARVAVPLLYAAGAVSLGTGAALIFVFPAAERPVARRDLRLGVRFVTHF